MRMILALLFLLAPYVGHGQILTEPPAQPEDRAISLLVAVDFNGGVTQKNFCTISFGVYDSGTGIVHDLHVVMWFFDSRRGRWRTTREYFWHNHPQLRRLYDEIKSYVPATLDDPSSRVVRTLSVTSKSGDKFVSTPIYSTGKLETTNEHPKAVELFTYVNEKICVLY